MRIRKATIDDAVALAALATQLGYPADEAAITCRLRDAAGLVLVAIDADGMACGFAHAVPQHFLIAEPFVDIAGLVVGDGSRGNGVGKTLLAAVEAWARDQGFASLRVRSNVLRERAHRFYLREGYAEKKRQAVFIKRF